MKCNSIGSLLWERALPCQEHIIMDNWSQDLPLPLSLLKNLSSASAGGRELSVGTQYL